MTRGEIRAALIGAVGEIQQQSGRPIPAVGDDTQPLVDLEGFDSLSCVEVEVLISQRLQQEIKDIPFKDPDHAGPLRVKDIVDRLCQSLGAEIGR